MWIGQRLKKDWSDGAENRRAGADTERQRQNPDDSKSRMIAQFPHREAHIGGKRSYHILLSIRTYLFLSDTHVPQFQPRRPLCIFSRKSTRLPGSSRFLEIMLDLLADFPILFGLPQQSAETMSELAPEGHGAKPPL
jgi:hypothetical protein